MNKEEIKKLKEHYEKQVILSYVLNDVKHYKEHLLILEVLDENESLKEIEEEHRKINGELREENEELKDNWNMLKEHLKNRYDNGTESISYRQVFMEIREAMQELEQGSDCNGNN